MIFMLRNTMFFLFLLFTTGLVAPENPDTWISIRLQPFATGITSPIGMDAPLDGTGRIFIQEQQGRVRIIKNGNVLPVPFLDLKSKIGSLNPAYSEKGLLGLAFHPDYKNNGRFFVYYSSPASTNSMDHTSILAEYHVSKEDPNRADPTEKIIMAIAEPEANHNGGQLAFGPDGYLYIGLGDGGGANDEHGTNGNGQNLQTLLGKILRINVNGKPPYEIPTDNPFVGKDFKPEIWAYGLRNPWRFSFDPVTGRLFCGDVGQNKYEEINIIEKGKNYGWRIMEAGHCFNPSSNCDITKLTLPIYEYSHQEGISVTGGYIYRGSSYASLHGYYIFADWSGKLFALKQDSAGKWNPVKVLVNGKAIKDTGFKINSMGRDENGEIYLITQTLFGPKSPTGKVYKITL